MIQNTGETLGDLVHADGNNGALLGYELAGKPYVAVDEVEGISDFLVQGCDKEELFASGCMKAAQGLHVKATPHGLIVQENGHGTCSIALHGRLIQERKIRVDKIRRMRSLGDRNEIADLRRELVAERDKYNKLFQWVECQEQSQYGVGQEDWAFFCNSSTEAHMGFF